MAGSRARRGWEERLEQEAAHLGGRLGVAARHLATGQEIAFNATAEFPAASVIKLAIATGVMRCADAGALSTNQLLLLHEEDKVGGDGVLKDLHAGLLLTVRDLLVLMLTLSDNTATNMLIDLVTLPEIQRQMHQELGMPHCYLRGKLPTLASEQTSVITPAEILHLLEGLYRVQVASPAACAELLSILRRQPDRRGLSASLPRDTPVAHRPGHAAGLCHDAGIVYAPFGDYAACVLTQGLAQQEEGLQAVGRIARHLWDAFQG